MVRRAFLLILALAGWSYADTGFHSTVSLKTTDNATQCVAGQIKVSPGTLTCSGNVATVTTGSSGLPLPPGDTNYIQNTATLQSGATFYVSSGTVVNQFNLLGTGSETVPAISIGQGNTGFYNSGSGQLTMTANGTRRLDLLANGFASSQNNDSSGMFFSGQDTTINSNNSLIKFQNGVNGNTPMQIDVNLQSVSISAPLGLTTSFGTTTSSLTVTKSMYFTGNHSVNASYTAVSTDTVILASATPAGITITMHPATATGHNLTVVKVDLDSYTVTVNGNGSDLMQGTGTITLNGYRQTLQVQDTDTGNWSPWGHGIEATPAQIAALGNNGEAGASSAISASSDTYIYATSVGVPVCINSISVTVGTANGGMDLGIYDANGLLMTHTGTTVIAGANVQTLSLANAFCIPPGLYYIGFYCNNVTATFAKMTSTATRGAKRYTSAGGTSLPSSVSLSGGVTTAVGVYEVLGVAGGSTF